MSPSQEGILPNRQQTWHSTWTTSEWAWKGCTESYGLPHLLYRGESDSDSPFPAHTCWLRRRRQSRILRVPAVEEKCFIYWFLGRAQAQCRPGLSTISAPKRHRRKGSYRLPADTSRWLCWCSLPSYSLRSLWLRSSGATPHTLPSSHCFWPRFPSGHIRQAHSSVLRAPEPAWSVGLLFILFPLELSWIWAGSCEPVCSQWG